MPSPTSARPSGPSRSSSPAAAATSVACVNFPASPPHEHVFATGQTGNVALLGMRLAAGDLPGVGHYLVPTISFVVGIVLSKHILASVHGGERHPMMRWVALFEAAAFLIIAPLPSSAPDLLVNSFISFCAALSYENFRLFGTRSAYSSVFCTGRAL